MAASVVIYVLFVVAVNGSVPAVRLAEETGTAIGPLEEVAGPIVGVLGSIYVLLAFGIGAVFGSLGLYLQAGERIGSRLNSQRGRLAAGALPVVGIFALVALMLFLNLQLHRPAEPGGRSGRPAARRSLPDADPRVGSTTRRASAGTPLRWLGSWRWSRS